LARTIAKDHDEKRALIRKAAAKVFAEQGFDRASMSLLAKEAGISKANIYHYYGSKDALLFDLLDTKLAALLRRILMVDIDGMTPREALQATILEILLAYEGEDYEHQVQSTLLGLLPDDQQKTLIGYQRDMVQRISQLLRLAQPGVFETNKSQLRAATMSIFGMLNWYYMWEPAATPDQRREYAILVTTLVLDGSAAL
jgi:AcrR family transcriptional regulator